MREFIHSFPKQHRYALLGALGLLFVLLLLPSESAEASKDVIHVAADYQELAVGQEYPLPLEIKATSHYSQANTSTKQVRIKSGDSLATIFQRQNVPQKTMLQITRSGKLSQQFTKLIPGKYLTFTFDENNELIELQYATQAVETLVAKRLDDGKFETELEQKETVVTEKYFEGTINSNFWNAGVMAGLNDKLIMNLANIFQWDVDFALDIREGDHFSALVEQIFIDGEFAGYGEILAAEFTNQNDDFSAVRYSDGRYYTPSGDSMQKTFLRAPVSFKYISSSFSNRRYHPVQKRYKAHRGVDYAASTGTPVFAAGDGKVIKSGYDRFNGHHVFVEHGGGITTKYIHFSKRKVRKGAKVKQGQVIGLVGATGLAAGPHLHYEFLVNGVHRNPRTVSLPKANPISKDEKQRFLALAESRMDMLQHNKNLLLAMR
ncbi:peptidoglycan DD-metalloendopeptidase family protein [Psychrosphaera aestuarii]|uniref:peptidoglycan DD-metalloendopeptidase family protein n=1 Tax=Psychrosphaera aestuarii TaxID=1266052 RepID=UPI001B334D06|nr:peptidoglycan DD-metalloendopeptidase family protein [Psychrosphaera aestuarii]